MKEVWDEIKQAMGVKTFIATLLSIAILAVFAVLLSCALSKGSSHTRENIIAPATNTDQTNFTQ